MAARVGKIPEFAIKMSITGHDRDDTVTALLGPTNTGKTHHAIERMLGHRTGVIGLPLRLLAREVYDRIVSLRGPSVVALITGEERIVPERAQYWVCTAEAMPLEIGADFVAVDEIQLCADRERGHIFTDRLLNARGLKETLFLGSATIKPLIADLIPRAKFLRKERFSKLSWAGSKKLARLPARSAVVGFSVEAVYAMAELVRRQRGGAAVVLGALSPRTRNAQVELYQNGDVDYLIATDAIGMGLNLDVRHVAFSGLRKFDGKRNRDLWPDELAQIAGRAGRYQEDGTFGVTGEAAGLHEETIAAIEAHRFQPVRRIQYRNSSLQFGSIEALTGSLEQSPPAECMIRTQDADDVRVLASMCEDPMVMARAQDGQGVRRLWDVCQIPDFRKTSPGEHATLLSRIYQFLSDDPGCIPSHWISAQLQRIDRSDGDIDTLSRRLAHIRTWTYVAQRRGWVEDEDGWRDETRAVEDRLSDALHASLTQRFVDRRTSVLMRRLKQRESLVAQISDSGDVTVEDQFVGRLEGFRFEPDPKATGDEARTLQAAGTQALQMEFNLRADRFYNAPDPEIGMTEQGGLMWGEHAIGKLVKGADALSPRAEAFVDDIAGAQVSEKVARRLQHWIDRRIGTLFEPLTAMRDDEAVQGLAKGVAFQLVESIGVIPRDQIAQDIKALDQDARGLLRKHGVRFGQYTIFQPILLKPATTQMRLVLLSLFDGLDSFPEAPPPGLVTIPQIEGADAAQYTRAGYRLAGERAIRIDMLERLADQIRDQDTRNGFEAPADMLSITGLTLMQFADLMRGLGYKVTEGQRTPAPKAAPADTEKPGVAAASSAEADAAEKTVDPSDIGSSDTTPNVTSPEEPASEIASPEVENASVAPDLTPPPSKVDETASEDGATGESARPEATTDDTVKQPDAGEPPVAAVEQETFFTFAWAPPRRAGGRKPTANNNRNENRDDSGKKPQRPKGKGKPRHKSDRKDDGGQGRGRTFSSKPPRKEKAIDPDSPFAVLKALTEKD